jgi:hypothetical protein
MVDRIPRRRFRESGRLTADHGPDGAAVGEHSLPSDDSDNSVKPRSSFEPCKVTEAVEIARQFIRERHGSGKPLDEAGVFQRSTCQELMTAIRRGHVFEADAFLKIVNCLLATVDEGNDSRRRTARATLVFLHERRLISGTSQ